MTSRTQPDPADPTPAVATDAALAGLDLGNTVVDEVLQVTDKSLLAIGRCAGRSVVVKALTGSDRFWGDKLAHEIATYQALAAHPAPVVTPGLVHTDGARVLVIDRIPGRALDPDRYPARALGDDEITSVLDAVTAFARWAPPAGTLTPTFDYRDRLARYRGFLDPADAAVLDRLVADLGDPAAVAHGDPIPANLLRTTHPVTGATSVALLDFEFTGLFLPGFDFAMLHTLLVATPGAQTRIREAAAAAGIDNRALLVNQAMVLTRELRIHTELDPDAASTATLRRDRLALIEPQLRDLSHELGEYR